MTSRAFFSWKTRTPASIALSGSRNTPLAFDCRTMRRRSSREWTSASGRRNFFAIARLTTDTPRASQPAPIARADISRSTPEVDLLPGSRILVPFIRY